MARSDGGTLVLPMYTGSIITDSTSDLDALDPSVRLTKGDSIRSAQSLSILRNLNASETMPRNEELTINLCTDSVSDLESMYSTVKSANGYGSIRSVKSLSVFKSSDAPQTMARSEEVTLSLYEHDPSSPGNSTTLRQKKTRRTNETVKSQIENNRKMAEKDKPRESAGDELTSMRADRELLRRNSFLSDEADGTSTNESSKRLKQDSSNTPSNTDQTVGLKMFPHVEGSETNLKQVDRTLISTKNDDSTRSVVQLSTNGQRTSQEASEAQADVEKDERANTDGDSKEAEVRKKNYISARNVFLGGVSSNASASSSPASVRKVEEVATRTNESSKTVVKASEITRQSYDMALTLNADPTPTTMLTATSEDEINVSWRGPQNILSSESDRGRSPAERVHSRIDLDNSSSIPVLKTDLGEPVNIDWAIGANTGADTVNIKQADHATSEYDDGRMPSADESDDAQNRSNMRSHLMASAAAAAEEDENQLYRISSSRRGMPLVDSYDNVSDGRMPPENVDIDTGIDLASTSFSSQVKPHSTHAIKRTHSGASSSAAYEIRDQDRSYSDFSSAGQMHVSIGQDNGDDDSQSNAFVSHVRPRSAHAVHRTHSGASSGISYNAENTPGGYSDFISAGQMHVSIGQDNGDDDSQSNAFVSHVRPRSAHAVHRSHSGASSGISYNAENTPGGYSAFSSSEMLIPLYGGTSDDALSGSNVRAKAHVKSRDNHVITRTRSTESSVMLEDESTQDFTSQLPYRSNETRQSVESYDDAVRTHMKPRNSHSTQRHYSSASSNALDDIRSTRPVVHSDFRAGRIGPQSADDVVVDAAVVGTHMKPRNAHVIQRVHSGASSSDFTASVDSEPREWSAVQRGRPANQYSPTSSQATLTDDEQRVHSRRPFTSGIKERKPLSEARRSVTPQAFSRNSGRPTRQEVANKPHTRPLMVDIEQRQQRGSSPWRASNTDDAEVAVTLKPTRNGSLPKTFTSASKSPLTIDILLPEHDHYLSDDGSSIDMPAVQSNEMPTNRFYSSRAPPPATRQSPLTIEIQLPENTRNAMPSVSGGRQNHAPGNGTSKRSNIRPQNRPRLHNTSSRSMPNLADNEAYEDFEVYQKSSSSRKDRQPNQTGSRYKTNDSRRKHPQTRQLYSENDDTMLAMPRRFTSNDSQDPRPARRYRPRSTAGSSKRAHLTGIGVENRRHRKGWRTEGMPSTDIEDAYDVSDIDDDRLPARNIGRRSRHHVARIYVDDDDDGGLQRLKRPMSALNSVFSEPATVRRPRSAMSMIQYTHHPDQQPLIEYRRSVVSVSSNANDTSRTPRTPLPQLNFQHMDTQVSLLSSETPLSPDPSLAGVDPELRDARKTGANYNITLTLKPLMTVGGNGSVLDQQYNHSIAMNTSREVSAATNSAAQAPYVSQTPVSFTQNFQPENRDRRPNQEYTDVITVGQGRRSVAAPSIVEVGSRPQSSASRTRQSTVRRSESQIGFDIEVQSLSDSEDDEADYMPQIDAMTSRRQRQRTSKQPQFEIPLRSSIDINYNPPESNDDALGRRKPKQIPAVERQRFLVSNALEPSRPPKMVDVPVDDEEFYDDPMDDEVEGNANMFDTRYFENKENPLYSSDPDLSLPVDEMLSARHIPKTRQPAKNTSDDELTPSYETPVRSQRRSPSPHDEEPIQRQSVPPPVMRTRPEVKQPIVKETDRKTKPKREAVENPAMLDSDEALQRANRRPGRRDVSDAHSENEINETWTTYHTVPIESRVVQQSTAVDKSRESYDSALHVQQMYEKGDFDQEISVSRGYDRTANKPRNQKNQRMISQRHGTGNRSEGSEVLTVSEMVQTLDVRSLLQGATSASVRQTIDVERLEDEILTDRPNQSDSGVHDSNVSLDYDTVSEQVEMFVADNGMAITTSRVRCERTVPIRGSSEMFKKSSVLVTKRIEVDLMATPARKRLWNLIKGVHTTVSDDPSTSGSENPSDCPLSKSDTFVLYKKFLSLAEMTKATNLSKS